MYTECFGSILLILSTDNQFAQASDESQECTKPNLCVLINVCAAWCSSVAVNKNTVEIEQRTRPRKLK